MKKIIKNIIFNFWKRNPKTITRPENTIGSAKSILFLRQDRIGDLIISTPVFSALRDRFPKSRMDILLSKYNRQAYSLCGKDLDGYFYMKKGFWGFIAAILRIRKVKYDVVIDLTDNASTTSTLILGFCGAKSCLGFNKENRNVYNYIVNIPSKSEVHIALRLLMLLIPFGIDINKIHNKPIVKLDNSITEDLRETYQINKNAIGVIVSGSSKAKFWGFENLNAFLIELTRSTERQILIYQTPQYPNVSDQLIENRRIKYLKPGRSIHEFASLVSFSSLIITPDTAAIHLGSALGIPQVVMFKVSNRKKFGMPWYPIGVPYKVFEDQKDIKNINPTDVVKATLEFL